MLKNIKELYTQKQGVREVFLSFFSSKNTFNDKFNNINRGVLS